MNMKSQSFFYFSSSLLFHALVHFTSFAAVRPQSRCLDADRTALIHLKNRFSYGCDSPAPVSGVASWEAGGDCCTWSGVRCDGETGRVVSLDLSDSCLHGSIDSDSTLFRLSGLEELDLSHNNFSFSPIPPELGRLSSLVVLDLSSAFFAGEIPPEISLLSNLSSLKLDDNALSSEVPRFLANSTSLVRLSLKNCGLRGRFPDTIFGLPRLEVLIVTQNPNLGGSLPDFRPGSRLTKLVLSNTRFSGRVPLSIGNLSSLEYLSLARAEFSGVLPSSIGKLGRLVHLDFTSNNFTGPVPSFLLNLTKLSTLWFGMNRLTGWIPPWTGNLTSLTVLSFARNELDGPVPESLSRLTNLKTLNLYENWLYGSVSFEDMIRGMTSLAELRFDGNSLSVITSGAGEANATSLGITFEVLGLNLCRLGHFPGFLRGQDKLRYLDLGGNGIPGSIPEWIWNTSKNTMAYLALNNNQLTSIESDLLCGLSSLQLLDLSDNSLSGTTLLRCLGDNSLAVLSIRNNSLGGTIPDFCSNNGTSLKMVDLSYNELTGQIPRSLQNCSRLESLNLRNNQLVDVFPWWLGALPSLRMLVLKSNRLHGEITSRPASQPLFAYLRVIDVSQNEFSGSLPSEYFRDWNAMKNVEASTSYLKANTSFEALKRDWSRAYAYSTTITIKGSEVRYGKIQEALVVVDFSSNGFTGEIPDSVGGLKGLRVLSLSNNFLTGKIPSSLGSLTSLESLDLSRNSLSGEIPPELAGLTFMSFLNVSYNGLTGRIPRGGQFDTFDRSSYLGNRGLCGLPLPEKCAGTEPPSSKKPAKEDDTESSFFEVNWISIALGLGTGAAIGVFIESSVVTKKRRLRILETCGLRKQQEEEIYEAEPEPGTQI